MTRTSRRGEAPYLSKGSAQEAMWQVLSRPRDGRECMIRELSIQPHDPNSSYNGRFVKRYKEHSSIHLVDMGISARVAMAR